PSFVARCAGVPPEDAFLMLCFERGGVETRIVHVTLHAGVRRALELLTRDRVLHALRSADRALRRLGVASPRLAVAGLNPHAGEGGLFGDEEKEVIVPAIRDAAANGVAAEGPFGADTILRREGYDACVVMLHDQGHIAAKLLAPAGAAALTIGTPVLFSSVAHGSALDIAGKNRATPAALIGRSGVSRTRAHARERRRPAAASCASAGDVDAVPGSVVAAVLVSGLARHRARRVLGAGVSAASAHARHGGALDHGGALARHHGTFDDGLVHDRAAAAGQDDGRQGKQEQ